jgi:hypothetical protein
MLNENIKLTDIKPALNENQADKMNLQTLTCKSNKSPHQAESFDSGRNEDYKGII